METLIFNNEPLVPLVSGFTRSRNSGVIQNEANAGTRRQRKKYFDSPHLASVSFYLDSPELVDYFTTFIRDNEGEMFNCYLAADRPIVETYLVQAISEWQFTTVDRETTIVSCQLEISSFKIPVLDHFLNAMYSTRGEDVYEIVKRLVEIVEVMPEP